VGVGDLPLLNLNRQKKNAQNKNITLLQAATECMYIFIRSQPAMVNTIPVSLFFCYNNEEHTSVTLYTVHYTLYISDL